MIEALFFDIDGTLIDHSAGGGGKIPHSTIACLNALRKKNIKLFVATGRPLEMVHFLEPIFPFDGFVTFNGQLAITQEGSVLHRMAHNPEDIRLLAKLVEEDPFPCLLLVETDKFYLKDYDVIRKHYKDLNLPIPQGPYDLNRLSQHPVLQFLAYIPYEDAVRRLQPLQHIEVTSAGGDILDIIPKGGGKEVGIAAVANQYGWKRENICVFGDGNNDCRMLEWAGTGIAMGNGTPAAKAAADYVTTHVGQNGIQNALLHFGLLSEKDLKNL